MTLSERIKYLRQRKGMSQEELSLKAHLGHNAVSRYENGRCEISGNALRALATALGVDPMELSGDREAWFFTMIEPMAYLPVRAHADDAGFDLFAPKYDLVPAQGSTVIDTGVHIQIPKGYAGLVVSKSGLNFKHGIISDGLIDAGYTGSIKVKLYNMTRSSFEIRPKDKISQIVFIKIVEPMLIKTDKLEETDRGDNGFGSTGR